MVVENGEFLKACRSKHVRTLLVVDRQEYTKDKVEFRNIAMRLCLDVPIPYTDKTESVFIDCPTEIKVDNYSNFSSGDPARYKGHGWICFHLSKYEGNHIEHFISLIKKGADVRFKVVAYNSTNNLAKVQYVSHQLYGYVNNKCFLLDSHTGPNVAAPVREDRNG